MVESQGRVDIFGRRINLSLLTYLPLLNSLTYRWIFSVEELTFRYPMMYEGDWHALTFHWWRLAICSILGAVMSLLGLFALSSSGLYLMKRIYQNDWGPKAFGYRKLLRRNCIVMIAGILCFGYFAVLQSVDDGLALINAAFVLPIVLSVTSAPIVFIELYLSWLLKRTSLMPV